MRDDDGTTRTTWATVGMDREEVKKKKKAYQKADRAAMQKPKSTRSKARVIDDRSPMSNFINVPSLHWPRSGSVRVRAFFTGPEPAPRGPV